jgi:hypothetical protein
VKHLINCLLYMQKGCEAVYVPAVTVQPDRAVQPFVTLGRSLISSDCGGRGVNLYAILGCRGIAEFENPWFIAFSEYGWGTTIKRTVYETYTNEKATCKVGRTPACVKICNSQDTMSATWRKERSTVETNEILKTAAHRSESWCWRQL